MNENEERLSGQEGPYNRQRVFKLLVLYRWLSLIPPLVFIFLSFSTGNGQLRHLLTLVAAVLATSVISLFSPQLNRALRIRPWLLLIDLLSVAAFVALSGGWRSPYYLYALSPLMAAALFFQLRGAYLATTLFLPFYITAIFFATALGSGGPDWFTVLVNIIGFYLISGAFGYAAALLARLRATGQELAAANRELESAHKELKVLHALTASLHRAADVEEVQEMVLTAVTSELGYRRAIMGLVDENAQAITAWLGRFQDGQIGRSKQLAYSARVPLDPDSGLVARALLDGRICRATEKEELCTTDEWVNAHFNMKGCLIIPMQWGVQPVGVLMVDASEHGEDQTRLRSMEAVARQTAVTLGMMITRQRRAKERAVQEERARIAMDIHDSVSQSLFGIIFTLTGSLKLLPENPETAATEIEHALETAEAVRQDIRQTIQDIWPEEITAQAFEDDLRKFVADVLQGANLHVNFDIRGDFSALSPRARRSLYRISQEALANIVHHAAASQASVCVDVVNNRATLSIRDDGRGLEPEVALSQQHGREHFGLRGIQERARSLGGTCDIFSQPGAGTSIVVDIPAHIDYE